VSEMEELVALLDDRVIGRVRRDARGRMSFAYEPSWREAEGAYPLSLSMPLAAREHDHDRIEPFLRGLLPDDPRLLESWARLFRISPRNVFAQLAHVGADCAGAVQFVRPDRLDEVLSGAADHTEWLEPRDVAARLRTLRDDPSARRLARDVGQFILAGAQPKTALLFENARWGIPSGRVPTTHILKPPLGRFEGHAENEHLCLTLARACGLPAARSQVLHFDDEVAIAIERYDRVRLGNRILRVHQEDLCQALGVSPLTKTQSEGGPGIKEIVEILRMHSSAPDEDVETFIDAVAFNWLIAEPEAHARNYSLLLGAGPRVRLAPLYGISSILPYDEAGARKIKLSMKVGGEYALRQIGSRQWRKLARKNQIDGDALIARLQAMAERLPDEVGAARDAAHRDGLDRGIIDRLAATLIARAGECAKILSLATVSAP